MTSIKFKVKLRLKGAKHCVLAEAGVDNEFANSDTIVFTIKDKNLYVLQVIL